MKYLSTIVLSLMLLGCSALGARETTTIFYSEAQEDTKENRDLAKELKQRQETAEQFNPGDTVIYVLKVNFTGIPAVFYPDKFYVGEILKIKEDGFVVVKWANGKTTESNPYMLAKYKAKE